MFQIEEELKKLPGKPGVYIMHGEKDGRHRNEKVSPNPNPKDPRPMYIGKRVRHDEKKNFSTWKYPWKYPSTKK